jgi:hypothetical protein
MSEYKKSYVKNNKDRISEQAKKYELENKDKLTEYRTKRYNKNREYILAVNKKYKQDNPHIHATKESKRRAAKLNRTPRWLTEVDFERIGNEYKLASILSKLTGTSWHVDHIVPLQGKLVSGLHVPYNLRVIPAKENISKTNKYEVI